MKRQHSSTRQQDSNKSNCTNPVMSSEDPYEILGVSKTATITEIKSAYRKLALKHHPDKIRGGADSKAEASQVFAKIGAAYEILSDKQKKQEYDDYIHGRRQAPSTAGFTHPNSPFYEDPFFSAHFGRGRGVGGFTDPFDLFRQVFGEDFGGAPRGSQSSNQFPQRPRNPFFDDPFFSSSPFGSFGGGGFFGGGHPSLFDMNQMMPGFNGANGGISSSFSTFSTSSSIGSGGRRESVSTTTRIVNGRKVTRTERTITNPDGTVERHVETDGEEDLLRLPEQQRPQLPSALHSEKSPLTTRTGHSEYVKNENEKAGRFGSYFSRKKRD